MALGNLYTDGVQIVCCPDDTLETMDYQPVDF